MGIRRLLFGTMALLAASFTPRSAAACSCVAFDDALDYLAQADVAFQGRLLRAEPRGSRLENVFQVVQVWKGDVTAEVSVDTGGGDCGSVGVVGGCDTILDVGRDYIVFAGYGAFDCMPTTHLCSGTAFVSQAALDQLGPGHPPASGPPPSCDLSSPCPDAGMPGTGGTPPIFGGTGGASGSTAGTAGAANGGAAGARSEPVLEGVRPNEASGCGCSVPSSSNRSSAFLVLALGALTLRRIRIGRRDRGARPSPFRASSSDPCRGFHRRG